MKSQAETRAEMNVAKTERAYAELAASMTPRGARRPDMQIGNDERVVKAVRSCLEHMGVRPGNVPDGLDDEDELIDWLCRPSGTMYRTVRLGKGWHGEAFGAMLGHMDTGEPVALIPRGTVGYWCLDAATGEKVRVTPDLAAHISDEATFFYKPLPSRPLDQRDLDSFVFGTFSKADYLIVIVVVQVTLGVALTLLSVRYERRSIEADVKSSGVVTALLNGIQKIKLAGAEDLAFAKWARGYAAYAKPTYNRPALLYARSTLITFVSLLGTILIYHIAATAHVAYDDYMAFSVAFGQVTGALMALTEVTSQIAQAKPMFEIVDPILQANPETDDDRPSVSSLGGTIEVTDVSFRYNEDQPYVLHELSFRVRPGEYVALVGESGCGKSTIMRLLLGFEEPDKGSIFYGPYDVRKVNLRSLRRHIGTVMQGGKLFLGNIYSNITIANPSATLDDAWRAAEIAGIADDIRAMPMGMQTLVTEGGGGISGGQRQRIMIARAVCGDRNILIFDEATSALDNITQKHVSDSLASLKCTRIVIAHRLSTVRKCDRILVVADGDIAEEGTYDELIAKGGLFADLVARQQVDF